jgi:hypothetical protein
MTKLLIKNFLFIFFAIAIFDNTSFAQGIDGRWNINVIKNEKTYPAWLEVYHSGMNQKVGKFVYIVGSARPVSRIIITGNKFSFSIPPQWDSEPNDLMVEGEINGDVLSGKVIEPNGNEFKWTGSRAPKMIKTKEPKWAKFKSIFNGKNLEGWYPDGNTNNWVAQNGVLKNTKSGANLLTNQKFDDFKLHIEFKVPKGGNSGIYLRGRYEVQVSDNNEPSIVHLGGVYGFLKALELPTSVPDIWHSYDITLTGRVVTVVLNGKTIISQAEIPGITGGAIDSDEASPGPIYLQGDHTEVEYRNIKISVPKM